MAARFGRRGFAGGAAALSVALWGSRTTSAAPALGFGEARHLLAPAFREPANRGALIKSPAELVVRTVHVLGLPVPDRTPPVRMMAELGQSLFDPPNVKGWPGGESWITTSTLLLRQQVLQRMIAAMTVWSPHVEQVAARSPAPAMQRLPVEGRSLRAMPDEVRPGPGLAGVDPATLVRTLLPHEPVGAVEPRDGRRGPWPPRPCSIQPIN
jgi:hypothetical protein